jgi:Flp pilus assembly protein protease CpaA
MTPLYISIPVLIWLSVCAWFDWKSRRVSNWLTLPVLGVAILVRALGFGRGDWRYIWLFAMLVILGWATHLVGGADAKASLAIIMLDPFLAAWAWAGVVVWYLIIRIGARSGRESKRFPGFIGFVLGVLAYFVMQLIVKAI